MDITAAGMANYSSSTVNSALSSSVRSSMSSDDQKLKDATIEFEAMFIKQMLNSMKKTITKNGLLDGGMGQEIFEDMLYDEYAKTMAQTANLGISDMMFSQLSTQRPDL